MNELIIFVVNTHMQAVTSPAGFKEHQVTGHQVTFTDPGTDVTLATGRSG